jgi:uncharacterized protein (TIGR00255 family)
MTGYGVIDAVFSGKKYRLNLKAVNHRFLELRFRMPRAWMALEVEARSIVQKKLQRGSFDLWVEEATGNSSESNRPRVKDFFSKLHRALDESEGFPLLAFPKPIRALVLSRFPELWMNEKGPEEVSVNPNDFLEAVRNLCDRVDEARLKEGSLLTEALSEHMRDLEKYREEIAARVPVLRKDWEAVYQQRLQKAAEDLKLTAIPQERILQELLVTAEKRDVAEELERIHIHLCALQKLLSEIPENAGKRLEFLLQELNREWTTLGNKIQNADISQFIVEAKLAIEKIREQSLNVV